MEPVLAIESMKVEFRTHEGVVKAVNELSYQVSKGETLGIVGESGSGKSVSSMAVMDILPKPPAFIAPESSIKFRGTELVGAESSVIKRMRGNKVSMIFQDPMTCLNPYLRVDKQMTEGLMLHKGVSKAQALEKARHLLEVVHVPDPAERLRCYPHELSGGMRQRVMIAMALMTDPELIFADEPTTALDVTVQKQILKLFSEVQTKFGTSIVLISHDLGVIATQSDQVMVMYAGQMMEHGSPEDLFERPAHPYTLALKRSIPDLHPREDEGERLETIEGTPPNLMQLKPGCPFANRCKEVMPACRQGSIPVKQVGANHMVRCLL